VPVLSKHTVLICPAYNSLFGLSPLILALFNLSIEKKNARLKNTAIVGGMAVIIASPLKI